MEAEIREREYRNWRKAVERSFGWQDEERRRASRVPRGAHGGPDGGPYPGRRGYGPRAAGYVRWWRAPAAVGSRHRVLDDRDQHILADSRSRASHSTTGTSGSRSSASRTVSAG